MDKKNENLAKNILAGVGTFALIKAAPVLVVGAAVGAALTNPEKTQKVVKDFANRVGEKAADFKADMEAKIAEMEAQMEADMYSADCECDGEGYDGEENTIFDEAEAVPTEEAEPAPDSEPAVEETEPVAEETEQEPDSAPEAEKTEQEPDSAPKTEGAKLRTKGERILNIMEQLAEQVVEVLNEE